MTLADQQVAAVAWNEPDGLMARGTVVVIPGRGEVPAVYERFGRRLGADAYRVRAVADPSVDAGLARAQISGFLADSSLPAPRVLAGSDTGALFAIMLAGSGPGAGMDALVLAGLPAASQAPGPARGRKSWTPGPPARLTARGLPPRSCAGGALYEPVPADWPERADLSGLRVPILGLHGGDDPISPLGPVRDRYAAAPQAELVSITAGRHDVLNDQTHRTVAAAVVLFLERIRQEAGPRPIAVWEQLRQ